MSNDSKADGCNAAWSFLNRSAMRILFVSPRQGWPFVSGAKIREYHFLRALGERCRITYAFFREPAFDAPRSQDLPFCEEIIAVPSPKAYSADRLVRGLVGRWPLPVLNYTSQGMTDVIRKSCTAEPFDAVHFDGIHMAAYAPLIRSILPRAQQFFDWHNIESEGMRRYAELSSSPLKATYARVTAGRLEKVEKDLLQNGYGNVVCSERERAQLLGISPNARIAVVENGVDTEYFQSAPGASDRKRILFVGLMAYHANIDAALWFAREIWPRLRQQLPGRILTIVGAKPVEAVLALRSEPGIEVTGTVPEVKPFYAEAFAAIAPLRTGAGTRLKILEAMAAGVPVISTPLGAEGLEVSPGRDILLAETVEEWSRAFTQLEDPGFRNGLITAAEQLARSRYDWKILRESLYQAYVHWLSKPAVASGNHHP
jgi:polysaccharide biosynthesis protein PslH